MKSTALPKDFKAWLNRPTPESKGKRGAKRVSLRKAAFLKALAKARARGEMPPNPWKKRKRIRSTSPKRAKQLKEYAVKRREFLRAHPWCQIWLAKAHRREQDVDSDGIIAGRWIDGIGHWSARVPAATDIHHRAGRIGTKLLDEKDWIAASRSEHEWCHANPREARALNLLK